MTEKTNSGAKSGTDPGVELKRITIAGAFAAVLMVLAIILDTPVSILAWLLLATSLLCIVYIVVASRILLIHFRSQDPEAELHD